MTSLIRCDECGYENFPQHRFCGMCGAGLVLPGSSSPRPISAYRQSAGERPDPQWKNSIPQDSAWRGPVGLNSARSNAISGQGQREDASPGAVQTTPRILEAAGDDPVQATAPEKSLRRESVAYLLEDNPSSHGGLVYLILALLLVVGTVTLWQRRQDVGVVLQNWFGIFQKSSTISNGKIPPEPGVPQLDSQAAEASKLPSSRPIPSAVMETAIPADHSNSASDLQSQSNVRPVESALATEHSDESAGPAASSVMETDGEKYLYGTDVPQDCARAQRDLSMAARANNAKAQSVLGAMYSTGHCVGRDLPLAYHWFARASQQEPNNAKIDQDLRVIWSQMTLSERQLALQAER
jgi:hypothetical protein